VGDKLLYISGLQVRHCDGLSGPERDLRSDRRQVGPDLPQLAARLGRIID